MHHRFYRLALLALLLSGMATSAAVPQLTTFFVTDSSLGIPGVFVVPAVLSAGALVGMAFLARRLGRRTEAPVDELVDASL